jgi:L-aminopeptidase/D-esterase-like protein
VTLTAVPGVAVGHATDTVGVTGVTVITLPTPNVTTVEIRGAAPGSRETALLAPGMRVETVHAIVLTGGSAFGLAAADGVVAALEGEGIGHPTLAGVVPIVPAAVIFDLWVGDSRARPDAAEGAAAYRAASREPVSMGSVGAGTGATVAGWRGPDAVRKGGVGSASVVVGDATVGALVLLNAVGDVFDLAGSPLTGGAPIPPGTPVGPTLPEQNTTLAVVATDAALDRSALTRLCVQGHDAFSACLRPSHTRYDGDAVFAVSCGDRDADPDALGVAVFEAVGRSIEAAMRTATPLGGIRAMEHGA